MVSLAAGSKAEVDAVYARAMALGAKDEGAAGPRGDSFYAGYFRDLDGNNDSGDKYDEVILSTCSRFARGLCHT